MSETRKLFESFKSNLNESKDNTKYIVCSYYDYKLHDLEDELFTNDWTEATLFAHDKLMKGFIVEIENTTTGKYKRINPDEYSEDFDGEFTIRPEELEESNLNEGFFNLYKSYDKLYGISKYSPNELKNFINDLKQYHRISDKDYKVLLNFAEKYQDLIDNTGYESNLVESNLNENDKKYIVTYTKIDKRDNASYKEKEFDSRDKAEKFYKSLKDNKNYFYRNIRIEEE